MQSEELYYEVYDYTAAGNSVAYDTHFFERLEDAKKAYETWADHRPALLPGDAPFHTTKRSEIDFSSNTGQVFLHRAGDWGQDFIPSQTMNTETNQTKPRAECII
jgi:hypothetical protein